MGIGSHVSHRAGRVAAGCTLAFLLSLAGGCALPPQPTTPASAALATSSSAAASATGDKSRDAEAFGTALQFALLSPTSFSAEPMADVKPDGFSRVYAHVSSVSTSPASVTFDVAQYYQGSSAAGQAARDHQPAPDNDVYERNAFLHQQKASLATSAGVVVQFPDATDVAHGYEGASRLTALPFDEFASRFASGADSARLKRAGYWIVLDEDGIQSIAEQYQP